MVALALAPPAAAVTADERALLCGAVLRAALAYVARLEPESAAARRTWRVAQGCASEITRLARSVTEATDALVALVRGALATLATATALDALEVRLRLARTLGRLAERDRPRATTAPSRRARPATPDPRHAAPDPRPATPDPRHAAPDPRPATPDPRPAAPDPRPAAPPPVSVKPTSDAAVPPASVPPRPTATSRPKSAKSRPAPAPYRRGRSSPFVRLTPPGPAP